MPYSLDDPFDFKIYHAYYHNGKTFHKKPVLGLANRFRHVSIVSFESCFYIRGLNDGLFPILFLWQIFVFVIVTRLVDLCDADQCNLEKCSLFVEIIKFGL